MSARICLITGANSGLGRITALELARKGFNIVMLCRDIERSRPVQQEIQAAGRLAGWQTPTVELIPCDLGSQQSIREAAQAVRNRFERLDVLINNAGRVVDSLQYSPEGIELTFQTNYLSHFLLTHLLLDLLRRSDEARIINVASEFHRLARFKEIPSRDASHYSAIGAYNDSKLAKMLFTFELADRLMGEGITVNALHPWLVDTHFAEGGDAKGLLYLAFQFFKTFAPGPERLAETHIYLASSPEVRHVTGLYFANCRWEPPSQMAQNRELGRKLWSLSEQLTGITDYVASPYSLT
ncbi:NAD(P)-dependent dehydrogenase (short-subunit alcohol dehydrogenase family) [Larkinella arboricola]|uniref:NAD(P)-dependent dehydrogenase (Short-subunit alcohol dehydrogenase family) n=1 Tax=Larkinella arboricola TaxID=643671 RepID=A0A327WVU2_LARAB|nr:SDR family NAD(P)-dependent oxidoreductase [Larkinella arboricola]RAJ95851.1 NAD(P)-dependent dehydrogenase (short-subunit alcohol dehydrogenase family) [Larkinella arboricola]